MTVSVGVAACHSSRELLFFQPSQSIVGITDALLPVSQLGQAEQLIIAVGYGSSVRIGQARSLPGFSVGIGDGLSFRIAYFYRPSQCIVLYPGNPKPVLQLLQLA